MENRSHALMTGIFTIALLVATVLIGLWFNRDKTELVQYEIVTTQSIPGLNPQATVRYRGLEIGRVDTIVFDPRVTGQILIRLSVDEASPITSTTYGLGASAMRYSKAQSVLANSKSDVTVAQEKLSARLTQQFASMDSKVAAYKSTQTFLTNQIAAWNAN